jgi:hypothetical protein
VRRAAYDRCAAVTQLHAGGAIAEELDLDDFACSVTDRWLQKISFPLDEHVGQSSEYVLHACGCSIMLFAVRGYHCNHILISLHIDHI